MERYIASNWDLVCQPLKRGNKIVDMYNIRNRVTGKLEINWTRKREIAERKINLMIDQRIALLENGQ